jgi:hypothetical protein
MVHCSRGRWRRIGATLLTSRVIFDVAVGVVLGLDQVVGSVEFGGTLQVRGLVASFQRLVLVLFGGVVGRLEEVGLIFAVHRLQVVHSGAEVARLVRRTRALEPCHNKGGVNEEGGGGANGRIR